MTIKELAYSVQQYLQSKTDSSFKRAHIYELLAASFGFGSYAALSAGYVLTEKAITVRSPTSFEVTIQNRSNELGFQPTLAKAVSHLLPDFLDFHQIGVMDLTLLLAHLRHEAEGNLEYPVDDDAYEDQDDWEESLEDREVILAALLNSALLQDGLERAASKGIDLAVDILNLLQAFRSDQLKRNIEDAGQGRTLRAH